MNEPDELLLRAVLDTIREGIITIDPTGTIVLINQEVQRIWGYAEDELIGQQLDMLLAEEYQAAQVAEMQSYLEVGAPYVVERRIELKGLKKDGTTFPLEAFVRETPIGERLLFTVAVRDLSRHRRSERHLAVQYAVNQVLTEVFSLDDVAAKLLQAIGEGLGWEVGAFWRVDQHANVLQCTETWHAASVTATAFESISQQTSLQRGVELPGRVWMSGEPAWVADILNDRSSARFRAAAQAGLRGAFAFPIHSKRRILGVMEFFSRKIQYPDADLLQLITALGNQIGQFMERKRAEEEWFRELVENIREVFWIIDAKTFQVIYISPTYEEIWDRPCQSLYEQPESFLDTLHPEDRERVIVAFEKQLRGESEEEYRIMRPDGSIRWIWVRAFPVRNEIGEIYRVVGIAEDITERKRMEEALRARARQQAVVAEVGQRALAGSNLSALMSEAVRLVADTLEVEYCKVLELLPKDDALLLRAGVGWQDDLIGRATVGTGADSQAGYTLLSNKPVIVEDLRTETRFSGPPLLYNHGVVSGMNVIIQGPGATPGALWAGYPARPFGVLGAHTTQRREFSQDDVHFLQAIANVLATAIERKRAEEAVQQYAERLQHVHELDQAILAAQSSEEIAQAALRQIRQLVPCHRAIVTLFNFETHEALILAVYFNSETTMLPGDRFALRAFESLAELGQGKIQVIEDISTLAHPTPTMQTLRAQGLRSYISAPLLSEGELIGTFSLAADSPGAFGSEHVDIAREVATELAIAIQHARLFEHVRVGRERLEILSRRLLEAQEEERRRIARELHDQIGQALTAMKINLQAMQRLPDASMLAPHLEESIGITEHVLQQVRNLSLDLRPSLLDDLGLVSALRWYVDRLAQRSGLAVHFAADPLEARLPSDLETTCFRVAQEALTNVVRYARARSVSVEVRCSHRELQLVIRDDGVGFDVSAARERAAHGTSLGLLGMQERVELVGGQIEIESAPMRGTEMRVCFPLVSPQSSDARGEKRAS